MSVLNAAPGDVFYGGNEHGNGSQSWLYNNLTALWGPDVGTGGLSGIQRGGYFSTVAAPNLTVISCISNNFLVISRSFPVTALQHT